MRSIIAFYIREIRADPALPVAWSVFSYRLVDSDSCFLCKLRNVLDYHPFLAVKSWDHDDLTIPKYCTHFD
jgi:hypothetical protein